MTSAARHDRSGSRRNRKRSAEENTGMGNLVPGVGNPLLSGDGVGLRVLEAWPLNARSD